MAAKKNVVFIVKYFYPITRPSGISSFLYELCEQLAKEMNLTVISYKYHQENLDSYDHQGYKILKVNSPFPIRSARVAKKLEADIVVYFSGLYKLPLFILYMILNKITLGKATESYLCQCTHFARPIPKIIKPLLQSYDKILATHSDIVRNFSELVDKKAFYLPPGVDFTKLDNIEAVEKSEKFRIGFFGHFTHRKGVDILIDSFLKIDDKNIELLLAGGGKLPENYNKITQSHRNITVLGYHRNIKSYIKSCDLIVLPYRDSKSILGFAQSALEAMYFKVPIIASNVSAVAPLIKNSYDGYIFQDRKDLRAKILALKNNPQLLKKLGENAHLTIKNDFSIQETVKYFKKIIK